MAARISFRTDARYPLLGSLVRGGTSKCWLFHRDELPESRDRIDEVLVDVLGARDSRQIDGIGGGTSTTSKIAMIQTSARPDFNIEYEFGQVGIGDPRVEWYSDCGNCATAIALFAIEQGLVPVAGEVTRVVMLNTNTGTVIECEVDTPNCQLETDGTVEIPGVVGTGVGVRIIFRFSFGSGGTRAVLPTGNPSDSIEVSGAAMHASMLVAGAPVAILDSADIDATAVEPLSDVRMMLPFFTLARRAAARSMRSMIETQEDTKSIPKIGMIGAPREYLSISGEHILPDEYDFSIRMVSMDDPHPAIGLTTAAAVGVASVIEGTLVHQYLRDVGRHRTTMIRMGTPSGIVRLDVKQQQSSDGGQAVAVELARSARILGHASISVRTRATQSVA